MDRFIVWIAHQRTHRKSDLKSNMDRFIGSSLNGLFIADLNLKSNMDRFIEYNHNKDREKKQI